MLSFAKLCSIFFLGHAQSFIVVSLTIHAVLLDMYDMRLFGVPFSKLVS